MGELESQVSNDTMKKLSESNIWPLAQTPLAGLKTKAEATSGTTKTTVGITSISQLPTGSITSFSCRAGLSPTLL